MIAKRDTRLLQQRHQGWYFVQPVPRALQAKMGKRLVVVSRHTQSLREAQSKRTALEHEWQQVFERAARGAALSPLEIEEAARGRPMPASWRPWPWRRPKEGIDAAAWHTEEALKDHDWDQVQAAITSVAQRKGVQIEPGSRTYAALGEALLRARLEALYGRRKAMLGEPSEPPVAFTAAGIDPVTLQPVTMRRPKVPGSGPGFSEVSDKYLAERKREALSESTRRRLQTTFRLFADFSGNAPLAAIDRKMASTFLDTIGKLDGHWGQHKTSGLPLRELLKRYPGRLTNASLNHHSSALKSLFDWARKRGDVVGDNPFSEQSRKAGDQGWEPYTPKELKTLLGGLAGQMREITLVALFSGMRQGELLQLTGDDVHLEAGIRFFDLHKGLQLKSKAAVRRVPVHSALMGMGLHKRKGPLWSEWKDSAYFSKRFTVARRRLGLLRKGLSFHSTRGNLVTSLNQAGVHQADIAVVVGHSQGFTLDRYSGGPGLRRLQEIVEQARYPGL